MLNKVNVPNARKLLKQSISIPLHEKMTIEQAKYVIYSVKNFYN
jgi:dTDP-4-amino-4,6-dideoxygalactose transaminase